MRTMASQPAQQQEKEPPTLCEREKEKAKGSLIYNFEGWGRVWGNLVNLGRNTCA